MNDWNPRANELFLKALDLPEVERPAFLNAECAGDAPLEQAVQTLLRAHVAADGFLTAPHPQANATVRFGDSTRTVAPPIGRVGVVIAGKYKLLQQIGEGGMGAVWMADQTEPVKRRVAVKLIRAERGTSAAILARFEAERQAIALMDHPHVARLLDAGTTDDGAPYFIMELVKGVPLNEYCDAHKLSVPDRLQLFQLICGAVQHAHQKGIIHRDIKPSNILVESHDGKAVPKVIDFGLAKATSGLQLTENTLFTGFGTVMGTPLYMAPEQATFNAVDVDTRADIYALGVILYELLTGTTPLTRDTIRKAALDEMLKLVREQEAPTPSSRLSSAENKPSVAANRQSEPLKLGRYVKGELDWIVLKALSKDRDRRYETANGFAADVGRFLNHEAVLAGPVSTAYRVRKFVRRNRGQVIAASLVLLTLLAGIAGTTAGLYLANRAAHAERVAKEDAVNAQRDAEIEGQNAVFQLGRAEDALRSAQEQQKLAERATAGERSAKFDAEAQKGMAVQSASAEKRAKLQAQNRLIQLQKANDILFAIFEDLDIGKDVLGDGEPLEAVLAKRLISATKGLEGEALGDPEEVAGLQNNVGTTLVSLGHARDALPLLRKACDTYTRLHGPDHRETLRTMNTLALAHLEVGQVHKALPIFKDIFEKAKAKFGTEDKAALQYMNNLAECYQEAGQPDLARPLHEENFKQMKRLHGEHHPQTLSARHNLALCYFAVGQTTAAKALGQETLRLSQGAFGEDHPHTLLALSHLAECFRQTGELDRSVAMFEDLVRMTKAKMGSEHPHALMAINNLAVAYGDAGRDTRASKLFEEVLIAKRNKLGNEHPETIRGLANLAAAHWKSGRLEQSVPLFEEALKLQEKALGRSHPYTLGTVANLGVNYFDAGRVDESIPLFEEAYRGSKKFPELSWIRGNLYEAYTKVGKHEFAAKLVKEILTDARKIIRDTTPLSHSDLASFGSVLLWAQYYPEAETLLRRCLDLREKSLPDSWKTFNTQSMLGEALLRQKKFADAEPLLLAGFEGLKKRVQTVPKSGAGEFCIPETLDRLITLYTLTKQPEKVKKWRSERAAYALELAPAPRIAK